MARIEPARPDRMRRLAPDAVHMGGLLGQRHTLSRVNRLRHQEEDYFLWAFEEKCRLGFRPFDSPHPQRTMGDWPGEFLGTYLDASILSAWNSGDEELKTKIHGIIARWLPLQEEDGYLGTYFPEDRWQRWDVWVHRHDLIGLLRYYQWTRSPEALAAAIRIGDLILATHGLGKRPLTSALHMGMASSAIVGQMVWLYWETGDEQYLQFARWVVDHWEEPGGPAITSSLMSGKGVAGTATRKAAELQICLLGLLELHRATGEARYLDPVRVAWEDIVANEVYPTGTSSNGEYFTPDHVLHDDAQFHVGETCVTVSWLQMNLDLGGITGEAQFFDQAEQTVYNHLLTAQSPDGKGWMYLTGLRDNKRYRWHYDPDCCPQRGSRALALLPQYVLGVDGDGLVVNFFEPGRAACALPSGATAHVRVSTDYPANGAIRIALELDESDTAAGDAAATFGVRLRKPAWCRGYGVAVNDEALNVQPDRNGYLTLHRRWRGGDRIDLTLEMPVRLVTDRRNRPNRVAIARGPLVYAADTSLLPEGLNLDGLVLELDPNQPARDLRVVSVPEGVAGPLIEVPVARDTPADGGPVWSERELYRELRGREGHRIDWVPLVPFYDAGNRHPNIYADKGRFSPTQLGRDISYQVWLPYTWAERS